MSKTYFLVVYDVSKPKGANAAKKSIISESAANIILQDAGNPTITRKEDNSKWLVQDKRVFEFNHTADQSITFIVCDAKKITI